MVVAEKAKGRAPTYLITRDVVETLVNRYKISLDEGQKSEIKRLETEFVRKFWQCCGLSGSAVLKELGADHISEELSKMLRRTDTPYVSFDRTYVPVAQAYLEVTRLTDPKTGNVTITERPGNDPLETQIGRLREYQKVAIVDSGVFEGKTITKIVGMLEDRGISVSEVYLGVADYSFEMVGGRRVEVVGRFNFFEWIELKDLLGIDGRNVGAEGGIRLFVPYWENLDWASIPESNREKVVELCKSYNKELIDILRKYNDYLIKMIGMPIRY